MKRLGRIVGVTAQRRHDAEAFIHRCFHTVIAMIGVEDVHTLSTLIQLSIGACLGEGSVRARVNPEAFIQDRDLIVGRVFVSLLG